jgi:hypothetical protein
MAVRRALISPFQPITAPGMPASHRHPQASRLCSPEGRIARAFEFRMITFHDIIVRTIVDLPNEQVKKLALICRKEKISRAEAVRRAVEQWLRQTAGDGLQDYFGASKTRGSVTRHLARLRGEWARRN